MVTKIINMEQNPIPGTFGVFKEKLCLENYIWCLFLKIISKQSPVPDDSHGLGNELGRHKNASTWWRHQLETFSSLLALCAGNSPVSGEFPAQRPVTRSFDVFFDLRPNKRLSKQWWGWWFETPPCPLWRHRNEMLFDFGSRNSSTNTFEWGSNLS